MQLSLKRITDIHTISLCAHWAVEAKKREARASLPPSLGSRKWRRPTMSLKISWLQWRLVLLGLKVYKGL